MTNVRENWSIVSSDLQNRIITSRTFIRKWACLKHVQFLLLRRVDVCSSVACLLGDLYFGFLWQCSIDRHRDSSELNDNAGYKYGTLSSFQTSPGSVCSILMAIYISEGSEKTIRLLLPFEVCIRALHLVRWFVSHWVHDTHISSSIWW